MTIESTHLRACSSDSCASLPRGVAGDGGGGGGSEITGMWRTLERGGMEMRMTKMNERDSQSPE
jgi:hypothetical protein